MKITNLLRNISLVLPTFIDLQSQDSRTDDLKTTIGRTRRQNKSAKWFSIEKKPWMIKGSASYLN